MITILKINIKSEEMVNKKKTTQTVVLFRKRYDNMITPVITPPRIIAMMATITIV